MKKQKLPPDFVKRIKAVTNKRPKTVIDHILKNGFITTEELKTKYGYNHPPRAARDVREEGIPLETFRVKNSEGRSIGAYRFGDPQKARFDKLAGRKTFSKQFKQEIIDSIGCKCTVCLEQYEERYLQVDHRIPYEIFGDNDAENRDINHYMLLCGSCNRAKSWSCEHCTNWLKNKDPKICKSCYWVNPEDYKHIAMQDIRRVDIIWTGKETEVYEALKRQANNQKTDIPGYVKKALKKHIENGG